MNGQRLLLTSAVGAILLFLCLIVIFPVSGARQHVAESQAVRTQATTTPTAIQKPPQPPTVPTTSQGTYVEITDGCGPYFEGGCLNARSQPSASSTSVLQLRKGVVLPVAEQTVTDAAGHQWYKVVFTEWIRYPERIKGDLYVAADYVKAFTAESGELPAKAVAPSTNKRILVDRSEQKLYAYEGDTLFMETSISTGLELTPTPRGTFRVYRKTPSRYMQGPLPGISSQYYDLPGVPWNLYFTNEGGAIHGAYWHTHFGSPWSHGCVNLPLDEAEKLYDWAPLGTPVTVRD